MPYVVTAAEYLEIDGVPLSTPAWVTSDMDDLWGSADVRGDDVVIPGAAGALAQPRRRTATKATVELQVMGDTDWEGGAYANPAAGLATNCAHLLALTDPPGTTDGTRTAILHFPTGAPVATKTGPVHVLRLRLSRKSRDFAIGQLELSIPAGALA